MLSERFGNREYDSSAFKDGITLDIVEVTVAVCIVLVVQTVGIQRFDKRSILEPFIGQVG